MEKPLITVVMSVYNGAEFLAEALDSILDQSFRDFEFVIVNDGSSDDSDKILRAVVDDRVKIIDQQKNIGLTRALNLACSQARGRLIVRQDADDISHPERLARIAALPEAVELGASGWTQFSQRLPGSESRVCRLLRLSDGALGNLLVACMNPYVHGSLFFSKRLFDLVGGYDESFRYAQDYDFILRARERAEFHYLPQPLYSLRVHEKSISRTSGRQQFICALRARSRLSHSLFRPFGVAVFSFFHCVRTRSLNPLVWIFSNE